MSPPRYPKLDLPLPLELVNSRFASSGQAVDALATLEDLDAWLHVNADQFDTPPPAATPAQLERYRTLREALQRLLLAVVDRSPPPSDAVHLLNVLSAAAPRFPRLEILDEHPYDRRMRKVQVELGGSPDVALASVARACIELLGGPDRERVRRCGGPGCVLFFLKDGRRREWCSDICGNRARVARHYVRHHHGSVYPK
jgi:predicted RNA-binding Zn ribbon-like protein